MKVIKLNEASRSDIKMAEDAFNAAYGNDKLDILSEFLEDNTEIPDLTIKLICTYGVEFVNQWVNAMKWEELGRDDNEFINLLSNITDHDAPLLSQDNFTKIYNAYSDGSVENEFIDNENELNSRVWRDIVLNGDQKRELYSNSDGDFRSILEILHDLIINETDPETIKEIFYEKDDDGTETGSINSLSEIKNIIDSKKDLKKNNDNKKYSNLSDKQAEEIIRSLAQRDGMIDIMKEIIGDNNN